MPAVLTERPATEMPDEITMGELARRLDGFEKRNEDAFRTLNNRFDTLQFVHRDTYVVEMAAMDERIKVQRGRIDDIEERNRWLVRALATAFLMPLLVGVFLFLVLQQ
jgi:hypothetical protein